MSLSKSEIGRRLKIYLKQHTESLPPHYCIDCKALASVYDSLAGDNYCLECLQKSLVKDEEEFIEHTEGYEGN